MFSKLLVAAFVGMALAGQDEDAIAISKQQALTSSFTSRLAARLKAAKVNHGMLRVSYKESAVLTPAQFFWFDHTSGFACAASSQCMQTGLLRGSVSSIAHACFGRPHWAHQLTRCRFSDALRS
jgi:hypothetical protein